MSEMVVVPSVERVDQLEKRIAVRWRGGQAN